MDNDSLSSDDSRNFFDTVEAGSAEKIQQFTKHVTDDLAKQLRGRQSELVHKQEKKVRKITFLFTIL